MQKIANQPNIALIGGMADLYHRLWSKDITIKLEIFLDQIVDTIAQQGLTVQKIPTVSTPENAEHARTEILNQNLDLLIVVLARLLTPSR